MSIKKIKSLLINYIPFLKKWYQHKQLKKSPFFKLDTESVFTKIYKEKMWSKSPDTKSMSYYSGTGSYGDVAEQYVDFVVQFINEHRIHAVTDLGCGDFHIGGQVVKKSISELVYNGCDIVKDLIEYNQKNYAGPNIYFYHLDAVNEDLPKAELLLIREVLQHLDNKKIFKILEKIKNYKYVLVTEHLLAPGLEKAYNLDMQTGWGTRLSKGSGIYLNKKPFNISTKEVLRCRDDMGTTEAYIVTYLIEHVVPV